MNKHFRSHVIQCDICRMIFDHIFIVLPIHGGLIAEVKVLEPVVPVCLGSGRIAKAEFVPCPACVFLDSTAQLNCTLCSGTRKIIKSISLAFEIFVLSKDDKGVIVGDWHSIHELEVFELLTGLKWMTFAEAVTLLYQGSVINVNTSTMLRCAETRKEEERSERSV